ncbi:MAG: pilus assembly protein [Alphaproteobacteria bacterium]|nr:pilus assembly protein [Alphaproteobacteria bacterium]
MKRWTAGEEAIAAVEFSLLFPILLTLLFGVFDMGYGILAAQKTIRASQVTADLVSRHKSVSATDIAEAVAGGRLALVPFGTDTSYGYDVISLEFDEDGVAMMPPLWRETGGNISADNSFANSLDGLGEPGSGLIVVRVRYTYEPLFSGYLLGTMNFSEIAFMRPRNSATVPRQDEASGA